jgi:kinesin family protein 13
MKVVRYDPSTEEGKKVEDTYIKDDATQVDSVILNDSKYNRYLPLKVSGVNFPLPDASVLAGKKVNSVVVLAPVDYDFVKEAEEEEERTGRSAPVQVQGVRFIAGNILKTLIKNPTEENYKSWLAKEKSHPADRQSVVLLVVS